MKAQLQQSSFDLSPAVDVVRRNGTRRDLCIKILQELQAAYGFLPAGALQYVIEHTAKSETHRNLPASLN